MALDRDLTAAVRRLDPFDLRRLMIVVRGLLLHADGAVGDVVDAQGEPVGVSYHQEHVRCGKESCGTCPHGPYWYATWREDGRTRRQYVGRHLPGQPLEPVVPDLAPAARGDDG